MNGILMALFGTLGTFLITALGAAGIFFVRREVSGNLQCGFLGFAGGVMIAASVWSLLLPGIDFAEANGQVGWLVMTGGFLLGVITLLVADGLMKAWYEREKSTQLTLGKSTAMLIIAITTHNIPEGMSVGLALPLVKEGVSKKRAFVIASMTAVVEPLFGVLAAVFARFANASIAILLAFAAGTMIYVVVEELIPQAHMGENGKMGTLGFVVGFLVMMILDVALG